MNKELFALYMKALEGQIEHAVERYLELELTYGTERADEELDKALEMCATIKDLDRAGVRPSDFGEDFIDAAFGPALLLLDLIKSGAIVADAPDGYRHITMPQPDQS